MSDQGLIIRSFGSRHCEFRFGVRCPGRFVDAVTACRNQRRLQCFDVVRKCAKARIHAKIESQISTADS